MSRLDPLWQLIFLVAAFLALRPASAGVLPEDRADVLYHYYDGGGVEIDGPSILVRKQVGRSVSLSGNYYVDTVTSASIDVVTTASPYDEERTELSAGIDYLTGDTLMSVSFTNSDENDYTADTWGFGISQEIFGGLTTISMGYGSGNDEVRRRGDDLFAAEVDRKAYRLGVSQVLTRNLLVGVDFETISDEGFLNNPYRQVRYLDAGSADGYAYQPEVYPSTRTSNALALRGRYHLPYRAAVFGAYRFFDDDWGITAHTAELGYTQPWGRGWLFELGYRYYTQGHADFYSDLFPYRDAQNFLARDKELSSFQSHSLRFGASYDLFEGGWRFFDRGTLNVYYDHILFEYDDFRDLTSGAPVGTEPFYDFSADVIQLFLSVWF